MLSFTASRLWELRDRHFKQLPRKAYDAMAGEDRWLRPEAGAATHLRAVELAGLGDPLDPGHLHGAVVTRSER